MSIRPPGPGARPALEDALAGAQRPAEATATAEAFGESVILRTEDLSVWYGQKQALDRITLSVPRGKITAIIGPSGCGKSTLIRLFNRMNDLIAGFRQEGRIYYEGYDLYAKEVDPVEIRRRIGMVFQKPNPFPKTIFENVAFGARVNGFRGNLRDLVERSLQQAALWDEVSDQLGKNALELSGGQQQRLCIARALAIEPEIILMDEPCSALDPVATLKIEDLMRQLVPRYTIVIVTHNMQQAARVSDYTAFLLAGEERVGRLVEFGRTEEIFTTPKDKRTEDYITGRFG